MCPRNPYFDASGVANVVFVGAGGLSLWATEFIKVMYGEKVNLAVTDLEVKNKQEAKCTH